MTRLASHEMGQPLPSTEPADPTTKPSKDELAALKAAYDEADAARTAAGALLVYQ